MSGRLTKSSRLLVYLTILFNCICCMASNGTMVVNIPRLSSKSMDGLRKTMDTSVTVIGVRAEIGTGISRMGNSASQ